MIGIIDLELSNVNSVARALKYIQSDYKIVPLDRLDSLSECEKLILPGVGNFFEAAERIRQSELKPILHTQVNDKNIPLLGICLGMQLLVDYGEEGGGAEGLGFVKGKTLYHRAASQDLLLPHIGWNDVDGAHMKLFDDTGDKPCFYFIHSYEVILEEQIKTAFCHYGEKFVAGFQKNNIIGVQFHPEKSQKVGLQILKNFCEGYF